MEDKKIQDLIKRIEKLEQAVFSKTFEPVEKKQNKNGKPNLRIIAQNTLLTNGQKKVTAIIGYHELITKEAVTEQIIKDSWIEGKFTGTYANTLLLRAINDDGLVRKLKEGKFDLSQSGEQFFKELSDSLSE